MQVTSMMVTWTAATYGKHVQLDGGGRGEGGRGEGRLTAGVVSDPAIGRGTPGEALALAPDCHDELFQADAVHALCQVAVPALSLKNYA